MKEQDFELHKARYDQFRQPYYFDRGFIRFGTGEICWTRRSPDPGERIRYPDYGIRIASTAEAIKFTDPVSKQAIKNAWLTQQGIQYFLLDETLGRAYLIDNLTNNQQKQIPANKSNYPIYWAQAIANPISATVIYEPPFHPTPEQRAYLKELILAAKMITALRNIRSYNNDSVSANSIIDAHVLNTVPSAFVSELSDDKIYYLSLGIVSRLKKKARYLLW